MDIPLFQPLSRVLCLHADGDVSLNAQLLCDEITTDNARDSLRRIIQCTRSLG